MLGKTLKKAVSWPKKPKTCEKEENPPLKKSAPGMGLIFLFVLFVFIFTWNKAGFNFFPNLLSDFFNHFRIFFHCQLGFLSAGFNFLSGKRVGIAGLFNYSIGN